MAEVKEEVTQTLSLIKHKILVLSGKGGVGKSTVSSSLAEALAAEGYKVGLLDIDICGPSQAHLMGVSRETVRQGPRGWIPVYVDASQRLSVMSIAFLLPSNTEAVIWRGPKKHAMIQQFISDVMWGPLDFLIIDAPPGTSDEHITIVDCLKTSDPDGAVIVTTPQAVSVADVRKELNFCQKTRLPVLGIVENMSGFVCPTCSECSEIFGKGGGLALAQAAQIPFLGEVPLDPRLAQAADAGQLPLKTVSDSPAVVALRAIAQKIAASVKRV